MPGGPHPYFAGWEPGLTDAAKDFGIAKVEYQVPAEWKLGTQTQLLESLAAQGTNAFGIFPGDAVGINSTLGELKAGGLTLGPVGSHIVSEVVQSALEADPDSYLSVAGPKWDLPQWRFPSGSQRQVNSLIGIVRLVGDEKLLPECEAHWRRFHVLAGSV